MVVIRLTREELLEKFVEETPAPVNNMSDEELESWTERVISWDEELDLDIEIKIMSKFEEEVKRARRKGGLGS